MTITISTLILWPGRAAARTTGTMLSPNTISMKPQFRMMLSTPIAIG